MDPKGKRAPILPVILGRGGNLPWLGTLSSGLPGVRKTLNQCEQIFHSAWDSVPTALPLGS